MNMYFCWVVSNPRMRVLMVDPVPLPVMFTQNDISSAWPPQLRIENNSLPGSAPSNRTNGPTGSGLS